MMRLLLLLLLISLNSFSQPNPDRPDLAAELDAYLTKDPALGYAPKERLQQVWEGIKLQRQNSNRGQLQFLTTANWVERGPSNVGGRTRALMYDPNDGTHKKVWAGGVGGGLWRTNDITVANPVWTAIDDFWANIAVSCIAYNPANPLHFYVGTGEGWYNADAIRGAGIWKTTDGGVTWTQLASTSTDNNFDYINKLVVDASGNVFAATRSRYCNRGGLYKSTNGGTSWTRVLGTQTASCGTSLCTAADIEIGADGTLYASIGIFQTGGIHKSTNSGTSWTQINTGTNGFPTTGYERIEIATAPSDANVLYALAQSSTTSGILNIYRSGDKGATWTTTALPFDADLGIGNEFTRGQAWYDLIAAVDPLNAAKVVVGGIDLFYSTNSGSSWSQISKWSNNANLNTLSCSEVHADQHAIVFQPGSSSVLIVGNDGGVYRCANVATAATSNQFSNKNSGYNVTQFYACAIHPTAGTHSFLAGAQDNGTQRFTAAGMNSTVEVTGGDGAYCFIDQSNSSYQISSYVYNNYYRTTNNWTSHSQVSSGSTGRFINPADYDDVNNILYSAYSTTEIRRISGMTNASPNSPVQFTVTGMNGTATHLRVSPHSPAGTTTLFVGNDEGRLFKVTNAHSSPSTTEITGPSFPVDASISCVEVGQTENNLLVTFYNYGVTSVWRTTDGGATWQNKEGNLPDMPVRWALYNPNNFEEVLIATELGVWSTNDVTVTTPSWAVNNNNLANVRVDMLQMRTSDKEVIAATHGRGVFSTNVFNTVFPPEADFTNYPVASCTGYNVTYTDVSTNSPTSWSWSFPGGTPPFSSVQNPVIIYNTAGTYPVTLIVSNGFGSDTITKTNHITIVNPPGNAGPVSGPSTVCYGQKNVQYSIPPVSGAIGYQWSLPVGATIVAGNNTNSITVDFSTASVSGNVIAYGTNAHCGGNSSTLAVTVSGTGPAVTGTLSFSNSSGISIDDVTMASPYPSELNVSGFAGAAQDVKVRINGLTHTFPDDIDVLLESPTGQLVTLMSDCGGGTDISSVNLTFSDSAAANVPDASVLTTAIYKPTNITSPDNYPPPGPGGSFGSNTGAASAPLSSFDNVTPNGTWKLYIMDDGSSDVGTIASWELIITGPVSLPPSTITGTSNVCKGQNGVTYSIPPVAQATGYAWTLPFGASIASGANTNSISVNFASNALSGNISVTPVNSCAGGTPSSAFPVTVASAGTVTVTISANTSSSICSGTSVTFTANSVNGGTPSYNWLKNGVSTGETGNLYITSTLANGDAIACILTSSLSCVANNPDTSNIITMTVNPSVTVGVSIVASKESICSGEQVTFTATPSNGGTPAYQWKVNGVNSGSNNPVFTTTSISDNDVVTCVMASTLPCAFGNPATSNAIVMNVDQETNVSVSISVNDSTVCSGTAVTFTANPVNGGSPSYQWIRNGQNVGTNSATYILADAANNDIIYCIMNSSLNCALGNPATSNSVTMSVTPSVVASVTISTANTSVCAGKQVSFSATPVNGGTPSYQWKRNGNNVGTNNPTFNTFVLANNDVITCVMTSTAQCASGSPATSNSLVMTVSPNVAASVTINASATTICSGTAVTFTANPVNGGSASYQWRVNGGNAGTNSPAFVTSTLAHGNVVSCVMTSGLQCTTGSPATSNSITMTVNPSVAASVSIQVNPDDTVCTGTNVIFTASPVNGGASPAYQWKRNNVNAGTGSVYSSSALVNNDTVKVVMTSNANCVSTNPVTNEMIVGVYSCAVTINLKAFFEGFYIVGADSMQSVADPAGSPHLSDTVTLQLADSVTKQITATDAKVLNTQGQATFYYTNLAPGRKYYLVLKHRNSLETWSRMPFVFDTPVKNLDFTSY